MELLSYIHQPSRSLLVLELVDGAKELQCLVDESADGRLAEADEGAVRVLPFYALTRPRWRWHLGNCSNRPSGWGGAQCCDCTHFCHTPSFWQRVGVRPFAEALRLA